MISTYGVSIVFFIFVSTVSRHICHRVSAISCLYLYEDSNFVSFRIPHVEVQAHAYMASASSIGLGPAAIEFRRRHASFVHTAHILTFVYNIDILAVNSICWDILIVI